MKVIGKYLLQKLSREDLLSVDEIIVVQHLHPRHVQFSNNVFFNFFAIEALPLAFRKIRHDQSKHILSLLAEPLLVGFRIVSFQIVVKSGIVAGTVLVYTAIYEENFFDGIQVWRAKTPPEHNKPLMLLLNLALGPGWPIDKTPNPSVMESLARRATAATPQRASAR